MINWGSRLANRRAAQQNGRTFTRLAPTVPFGARAFSELERSSLDLAFIRPGNHPARVNLVLPHFDQSQSFAGIATAVQFGMAISRRLNRPLRIISLQDRLPKAARVRSWRNASAQFGEFELPVEVIDRAELVGLPTSIDDVWIATYWTTAHAIDVGAAARVIDASRVLYLVQDYEPGFYPWSSDFAVARSTYHAGFNLVVNSAPVARYLAEHEGIEVSDSMVLQPQVDVESADIASGRTGATGLATVFFYARPSKSRNLFALGVAALRLASSDVQFNLVTAGEKHPPIDLAGDAETRVAGRLSWNDYFGLLAQSDVVFSLQHSPHPSHPPLDGLAAGAEVVTNELGGSRGALLEPARVVEARPQALASAIVDAVQTAMAKEERIPQLEFLGRLGRPLEAVLDAAVAAIDRRHR
jgi:hypothetical protein